MRCGTPLSDGARQHDSMLAYSAASWQIYSQRFVRWYMMTTRSRLLDRYHYFLIVELNQDMRERK